MLEMNLPSFFVGVVIAFLQFGNVYPASSTGLQNLQNETASVSPRPGSFVVPLVNYKNLLYYTELRIGTPWQTFKVAFDTAGVAWVPSTKCRTSEACKNRTKFDRSLSTSYEGPLFTILISFRENQIFGDMAKDNLKLADGPTAEKAYFVEATSINPLGNASEPYYGVPYDGIIGLDHDSFSLFAHLIKYNQIPEPLLAFYFSRERGEALFGDVDERRYSGSLRFAQVQGRYWEFNIERIQIGDGDNICSGSCPARTAPADQYIGGPGPEIARINAILGARETADGAFVVDCRNIRSLPNIGFTIAGQEFVLKASDYVVEVETSEGTECHSGFVPRPRQIGVHWHLGYAFLRSVYTVLEAPPNLEAGLGRVGFAYSR